MDAHRNFAVSTVLTAPVPATSGLTLTVAAGTGALFAFPMNLVVWPVGTQASAASAEIIRVTGIAGDILTIVRTQEGSANRAIVAGDLIAAAVTIKVLTDIESAIPNPIYGGDTGDLTTPPAAPANPAKGALWVHQDGTTSKNWLPNPSVGIPRWV